MARAPILLAALRDEASGGDVDARMWKRPDKAVAMKGRRIQTDLISHCLRPRR
jgi:hypothetical protein